MFGVDLDCIIIYNDSLFMITVLSNFLIILYYCPINLNYKFLIKN